MMTKPAFGTPINWDSWAAKGLVASFPFNEGAGRTVYNNVDMRPATMIGFGVEDTPTSGWVPGPHGGAISSSGPGGGYISANLFTITHPFTVTINFAPRALATETGVLVGVPNNVSARKIPKSAFSDHTFCTLSLVYLSSLSILSYINGAAIANVSGNFWGSSAFEIFSRSGGLNRCNCIISFVNIHSRVLSAEEITYLSLADPYAAYRWDDETIFPNTVPAKMNHMRRMVA
jgi:hypothetical protein